METNDELTEGLKRLSIETSNDPTVMMYGDEIELLEEDLVFEIFLRLPVKSLIRFRCVSKGMCGMIDSPNFVKNHNIYGCFLNGERDRSVSDDDYAILLFQPYYNRLFSVNFYDVNDLNRAEAIEFTNCNLAKEEGMVPMVSCNGVFCFQNNPNRFYENSSYVLWNPFNGATSRKVQPNCSADDVIHPSPVSVGYDYLNDDYKLIRFMDINGPSIQVYSFQNDSWRKFNGFFRSSKFRRPTRGVCLSSSMHWLWSSNDNTVKEEEEEEFIAVFDFVTETFRSLPLPLGTRQLKLKPFYLTDFGGRLSVTFSPPPGNTTFGQTLWVMEKYGVETCWSKLYTFDRTPYYTPNFYFPNSKRQLLCQCDGLRWWDPQDGNPFVGEPIEFQTSSTGQYKNAYVYVRNLVRL